MGTVPGKKGHAWSSRSRSSVILERNLQAQLQQVEADRQRLEARAASLEKERERLLEAPSIAGRVPEELLKRLLADLEDTRRMAAAYKDRAGALRSRIGDVQKKVAAEALKRRELQDELAQIAENRVRKDAAIQGALGDLRRLLQERSKATDEMGRLAKSLELSADLDASRFDDLLRSLSTDVLSGSRAWLDWFRGTGEVLKPCVVVDEVLELPETLAHTGLYVFGESVFLRQADAAELLREDRAKPGRTYGWEFLPPSVMTVEAFQEASAEATAKDVPASILLTLRHRDREREALSKLNAEAGLSVGRVG